MRLSIGLALAVLGLATATSAHETHPLDVHHGGTSGPTFVEAEGPHLIDETDGKHGSSGGVVGPPSGGQQGPAKDTEPADSKVTPPLTSGPFELLSGNNDPQVAVGATHVLVSSSNRLIFLDKATGKPTVTSGKLTQNSFSASSLFANQMEQVNAALGFPKSECMLKAINPNPPVADTWLCEKDFYDVRIRYDAVNQRYFVLAHVRNSKDNRHYAGLTGDALANAKAARRSREREFNVLAVSRTERPADGFDLFWWTEVLDQGCIKHCPDGSLYLPGQRADYHSFSINEGLLIEADNITDTLGPPYNIIHLIPLTVFFNPKPLAKAVSIINLHDAWGDVVAGGLRPVETIGGTLKRHHLVHTITHDGDTYLEIFSFEGNTGAQIGTQIMKLASPLQWPVDPPMLGTNRLFSVANLGNQVLNAVIRDGKLAAVFQDCRSWKGMGDSCAASIHLIEIKLGASLHKLRERVFGLRGPGDAKTAVVSYSAPGIIITAKDDLVLVYNRAGATLHPEVRFSVWMHDEPDIRSSRLLRAGTHSIAPTSDPATLAKPAWGADTAGISVDPHAGQSVWMAHVYGGLVNKKPGLRLAAGRLALP